MDLFNSIIPNWWAENITGTIPVGTAALVDRVWVAARCQALNSQQISGMPLKFHGPESAAEPAWVSSPDPHLYPNGIGDALYAIVDQIYGYGYSLQYITDTYSDGFPRTWTVLPSSMVTPRFVDGAREYRTNDDTILEPHRIVQIDRNPTAGRAHGTSALYAYAQRCWSLLAAGNQSMSVSSGGIPQAVLNSTRKLTSEQALEIQTQWMDATARRSGAPPVLPPELSFETLSINPSDLSLLETQEWDARVIATAYGVPSVILNMALQGGLTYQNPTALMQMWWLTELRTTAKRIGDAFTAQMLPRGQWLTFDASDITSAELNPESAADDPQLAEPAPMVANASPAQQPGRLTAVGGN